jgi:hypothetical protein
VQLEGPVESREAATAAARAHIAATALGWTVTGPDAVRDGDRMLELARRAAEPLPSHLTFAELDELPQRRRDPDDVRLPSPYGATMAGAWVVYVYDGPSMCIRASTIIVIDKATGRVRYAGSAHDEG